MANNSALGIALLAGAFALGVAVAMHQNQKRASARQALGCAVDCFDCASGSVLSCYSCGTCARYL